MPKPGDLSAYVDAFQPISGNGPEHLGREEIEARVSYLEKRREELVCHLRHLRECLAKLDSAIPFHYADPAPDGKDPT